MRKIYLALACALAYGCATQPVLLQQADVIYHNGTVVTVDEQDLIAEAVAVKGGRILAVGAVGEVMVYRGDDTQLVDLAGKTMMPGFIDAHGYFLRSALVAPMANLAAPPTGPVETTADLQDVLRRWAQTNEVEPGDWIVGHGYDDALLAEHRHPTRADLDQVSTTSPIFVAHVSGRVAVINSLAMELAGITPETRDPDGGRLGRDADGQPDGLLEGEAMARVFGKLLLPDLGVALELIAQAQREYASYGITTAQQATLEPRGLRALIAAAEDDLLMIDVVGYPNQAFIDEMIPDGVGYGHYYNGFRFGGVEIELDGSLRAGLAHVSTPYANVPVGRDADYRGQSEIDAAELDFIVNRYTERRLQMMADAAGDAAADQFIDAVTKTIETNGRADRRPILVHAQTLREEQLDKLEQLGIIPSFCGSKTYYFGDGYRDATLGADRAADVNPAAWADKRGIPFTLHTDAPVTPPDILRLIWSAAHRHTRSGEVLGTDQRISVMSAIRAVTINPAYAYFEEDLKGSIEPGKLADLVILSDNPLVVAPEAIPEIEVVETIKEGTTVYRTAATASTPQ